MPLDSYRAGPFTPFSQELFTEFGAVLDGFRAIQGNEGERVYVISFRMKNDTEMKGCFELSRIKDSDVLSDWENFRTRVKTEILKVAKATVSK